MNGLLSTIRSLDAGTLEGSVLSSPFNLPINDIVNGITLPVKSLLYYADDLPLRSKFIIRDSSPDFTFPMDRTKESDS